VGETMNNKKQKYY